MSYFRKIAAFLFNSKLRKVLSVLLISALIATASAAVYTFYYGTATASVQAPDLQFFPGSDSTTSCNSYPCLTATPSGAHGQFNTSIAISFSMFPGAAVSSLTPATYYTNATILNNTKTATNSHNITKISLLNLAGQSNLGEISVYFCATPTGFNLDGTLAVPGNCPYSSTITSSTVTTSTGVLFNGTFPYTLAPDKGLYVEVTAYSAESISSGSVNFTIAVQWT